MYQMTYTTPDDVSWQLEKANPGSTPSPAQAEYDDYFRLIRLYCVQMSAYVTRYTNRYFVPYRYEYKYYLNDEAIRRSASRGVIYMHDTLLYINQIKRNDEVVLPTLYRLDPAYYTPTDALRFDPSYTIWYNGTWDDHIAVSGLWGYVTDYSNAFSLRQSVVGTLTAGATTIDVGVTVSDYRELEYLRIGSEFVQIDSIDVPNTTITVKRGMNGTEAVEHTNYDIEVYRVDPAIAMVTTRLVAFAYQRRNDSTARVQYADGSTALNEMPPFVRENLDTYRSTFVRPI